MASSTHILTAVTSSARQLREVLRCISFASKAHVRVSEQGLRITTEESSITEAFVFLDKSLFTSYRYSAIPPPSSQDDAPPPPHFQISLAALLETLNIFTLSDPTASKASDAFAAHRINRHAGINAFTAHTSGVCTLSYAGEGYPLSVHMSEAGVTTTCDLTTYDPKSSEEIPFARDAIALKTIMRSASLSEAVSELAALNPATITILASPDADHQAGKPTLSLGAAGALGSATVEFTTATPSDTPVLETYTCPRKTGASFKFSLIKAAQRAMAAAAKVSLRLDEDGVLNLQFLVEVDGALAGGVAHTFVEFRIVPLMEGEAEEEHGFGGSDSEDS